MNILFLTENFPPEVNAAATRVYERAVYWAAAGHSVTVITCFPNFPQGRLHEGWRQRLWSRETMDGIRIVRVPTFIARNDGFILRTIDFVTFMVSATIASLFVGRTNVVVATSPQFFTAVAGWMVGVLKRRPFVFELGDLWPASIKAVGALKDGTIYHALEAVELFLYRRSAAVVALTDAFRGDLVARGIRPDKIHVVINGVDLPRYSPRPPDPDVSRMLGDAGAFTIGYIGTHGAAHDLMNVLKAAALLPPSSRARFLFVGDGSDKPRLVAQATQLGLRNVVFIDPQPKAAMPAWWSVCDVALIHLKNDRVFEDVIPSKIFEAMAMGRPLLLVAPEGEATRIVRNAAAGLIVPAGDPAALCSAVKQLEGGRAKCEQLAAASLAAAPRYSRKRQADDMLRVLEGVAAAERAP